MSQIEQNEVSRQKERASPSAKTEKQFILVNSELFTAVQHWHL